jgi:hypothetical protein
VVTPARRNRVTPEGWQLGKELARICDAEATRAGRDGRCNTCAFRAGDHLANGSPETLMSALKSAIERTPFWCHESDRPCKGWLLMRSAADEAREAPWPHCEGAQPPLSSPDTDHRGSA